MRQTKYFEAYLDDFNKIVIYMSKNSYDGTSRFFYLENDMNEKEELSIQTVEPTSKNYNKYTCFSKNKVEVGRKYYVIHEYARRCVLKTGYITKLKEFDECFAYDGDDLGASYSKQQTTFKLWAPTACDVHLNLNGISYDMKRSEKGIYEVTLKGDHEKKYYRYYVNVDGNWVACEDPYGKSSLANSQYSIVVDCEKFKDKKVKLPPLKHYTDAIIYEMNVRDFTAQNYSNDFQYSKKFLGVVEENEQTIEKKIGFSYLKELGITHVQLMPVLDFASVDELDQDLFYNWGYDPAQFMTLEGSYSRDANDPYARILEFKEMVRKLHEHGLRVNLDVVFNHVFDLDEMCLSKVVPNYYFQMNDKGYYSNGSWCGNDFDSRRAMGRKYIVDCCKYLMEMFHVDGFRFDLMGILDIETINLVRKECQKIDPNVMIYGEGWNMPSFLPQEERATILNDHKMEGVAHFSDRFRDIVKGKTSMEEVYRKGYCTGDVSLLPLMKDVLSASVCGYDAPQYFYEPTNVVNYVECHDNQTCWDKIKECCKSETREIRIARHKMCIAAIMFAQGIPFIQCGQEFARTKYGKPNTYNNKDDINWIMWDRKEIYETIVQATKDCIRLRKEHPSLRLSSRQKILENVSFADLENECLIYRTKDQQETLTILLNPLNKVYHYSFEGQDELLFYNGYVGDEIVNGYLKIEPLSTVVLRRKNK